MLTELQRKNNEHYVLLINNLSQLLPNEMFPNNVETLNNIYGFTKKDEENIREKIRKILEKIEF